MAESEFGGCRIAFKAMDNDKSNSLNYREFRSACRSYGYKGDIQALFASLDQHGNKHTLTLEEVSFLDDWESADDEPLTGLTVEELELAALSAPVDPMPQRVVYPVSSGPGDYNIDEALGGISAPPWTPMARHHGSYSFGLPTKKPGKAETGRGAAGGDRGVALPAAGTPTTAATPATPRAAAGTPTSAVEAAGKTLTGTSLYSTASTAGPGDYDPDELPTSLRRRKPAWTFGDPDGPPQQELWIPRSMIGKGLLVPVRRSINLNNSSIQNDNAQDAAHNNSRAINGRSTRNSISITRNSLPGNATPRGSQSHRRPTNGSVPPTQTRPSLVVATAA
eukprot:CAMPEP_0206479444 /NCGR_PEP_ID=MMETSP0324_2-20121206/36672_1 /ASSEMBLY_ACC=CAM_ASM_000836 /TAXON_ID=2866 /ORGANISM="Crypthecodinium cohnii, Strain Seligo" /LENGTH=335 /DNA_ID=CAMNT_0053955981 /DNA_START=92 /DNA_END=1099 /DNA_ORIENTATION=+